MEMKEKVLSSGHYLFENKPMIVKAWTRDMEMTKDDVKSVPAWVQIHKLPLKFWGKGLPKIAGLIGKYVKCDAATQDRTRLRYARVMVELMVDQELPAQIAFKDEKGMVIRVDIEYEWRPVKCKKCQGMGHEMEHCRKGNQGDGGKKPVKQVTGFVTPRKRLVRMHREEGDRSGYSAETFGAHSYKEVLTSPSKKNGSDIETKIKSKVLSKVVNNFNNWCISTNNGYHKNGRIWNLWDPKAFRIQFLEYNAQFIHMNVEALVTRSTFYLTMIYAFNCIQERTTLWDHLRKIAGQADGPWAMAVVDIQATGSLFTWNNKQQPEDRIYSRINRFMVNKAWSDHFPELYANFLPEGMMDHTPCLICSSTQVHKPKSFKYYNMWGASKEFVPLIKRCWSSTIQRTPLFRVTKNLKLLKPALKDLNREKFSDIKNATAIKQSRVAELQGMIGKDPSNMFLVTEEFEASKDLREMTEARDSFLAQKSKIHWLQQGDTNSSYFHGMIKKRRNGNRVMMIEDRTGHLCDTPEQIQNAFLEYYQGLLGDSKETKRVHRRIIEKGIRCNDDHHAMLCRPVTGKEVRDIVFGIPDIKSPGPDGFTSKFFKDAWSVIGGDIVSAVQDFFIHKKLLRQVNATTLTLVPKCERPQSVLQFRPIACCNVIYKIISKLLCSRLADVLPSIIDQNQGAFIQNRSIQENILICQDLIRLYERPNATPRCMFKIDLQKAYDTVERTFVEQLLDALNFPTDFKEMVLQCITTASFSLSLNGGMFGYFHGVPEDIKQDILRVSGFVEGRLPFKYLGMPIQTTRLKKSDCECLVEKICSRIHNYGAKKFFYAERLVLVKSVLSTLHSYWASMFVLPNGIISRIEATCRNFLWDNSSDYRKVPLVAWEKVCCTKEEGGLGIKDQETINKALIGRLVHWIMEERDSIWVNWVHQNYLKGKAWLDYKPSVNSSWVWRRICKVKEEMLTGYNDGTWTAQAKYTPAMGYEWLKDWRPAVTWSKWIWNEHVVPKHQFVGWLYAHGAMRTKDKLIKYGLEIDDSCFLCNQAAESLDHLWLVHTVDRYIYAEGGAACPVMGDGVSNMAAMKQE
ncbi:uncharacterized protein LOC141655409 [Silene latifolia]|uniref:uncharacterized protein LOC141655409 n=1 Tax=Silene latifolia TaxID=37657 RepID=UPI003D778218